MSLLDIARHEAAHALAAWAYGLKITEVNICVDPLNIFDKPQGLCMAKPVGPTLSAPLIFCTMAGPLMDQENKVEFARGNHGAKDDFKLLESYFELAGDTLKMVDFLTADPAPDVFAFMDAFSAPVLRLLRSKKGRRAIKALADQLTKTPVLSGAAAVSILSKAWRLPLPKMALTASSHGLDLKSKIASFDDLLFRLRLYAEAMDDTLESVRCTFSDRENAATDVFKKLLLHLQLAIMERGENL